MSASLLFSLLVGCPGPTSMPESCASTAECPSGLICAMEACVEPGPCTSAEDCPRYWSCEMNACVEPDPCASTDECPSGWTCEMNTCIEPDPCDACPTDFTCDGERCIAPDACAEMPCDPNAACTPTADGFTCACNEGYLGDGMTCVDATPCEPSPCDDNASCTTGDDGLAECTCARGFVGDGRSCERGFGQVVWIGQDLYESGPDSALLIGNAVALANTAGDIRVVGYTEYSDVAAGGEVANTDAAIQGRLGAIARTATIVHVAEMSALPAMLEDADVVLLYEWDTSFSPIVDTVVAALGAPLRAFLDRGGILIAMELFSEQWRFIDRAHLLRMVRATGGTSDPPICTITAPDDPLLEGHTGSTYAASAGWATAVTADGIAVVVGPNGYPVVVRKSLEPRFDGTVGTTWQSLRAGLENHRALMTHQPRNWPRIYNMFGTGTSYTPASNAWTLFDPPATRSGQFFQMAPVGPSLYGFAAGSQDLYRLDASTNEIVDLVTFTGRALRAMTVHDEAGRVLTYVQTGDLVIYNPALGVSYVTTSIGVELAETRVAYDPAERAVLVGAADGPELYRVDLDTGDTEMLAPIPESALNGIFCGDRSGHVYAAGGSSGTTMFQYDLATDTWSAIPDLPIDHGTDGTCTVSEEGYLYVSSGGTDLYRLELY